MKTHSRSVMMELEESGNSFVEIAEEIKPPPQRFKQVLLLMLVVVVVGSAFLLKVMSDQRQQANNSANDAVAAQRTAVAQVTALLQDIRNLSATVDAQSALSAIPEVPFNFEIVPSPAAEIRSRDLAYVALSQLPDDPERSILIALEANRVARTYEAEDALQRTLTASHLGIQLQSSANDIQTADFSPDGLLLVTTGLSGPARVWNLRTGALVVSLAGHTGRVNSAEFSPDGKYIVTASSDQTARLWDAHTGSSVAILTGHQSAVTDACFSGDGKQIATASKDKTVRIWDMNATMGTATQTLSPESVDTVEWSPDNQHIMAVSQMGLSVWDVHTGKQLVQVRNDVAGETGLDAHFAPDGKQLVISGPTFPRVIDTSSGQGIVTFNHIVADTIRFSPDNQWLLTDGLLRSHQTARPVFHFPEVFPSLEQFSPNSRVVVVRSEPHALSLWEIQPQGDLPQQVATLRSSSSYNAIEFSPDSQSIVSIGTDGRLTVWRVYSQTKLPSAYPRLIALAQRSVTRQLTCGERQSYLREDIQCLSPTPAPPSR